jgi:hypothetical protein
MRIPLAALAAFAAAAAQPVAARPVSWPGGITLIQELEPESVSGLLHYTPNRHWSLGARIMHMRDRERAVAGAQASWLVRRWNMPAAQANLYLSGMAGAGWDTGPDPAGQVRGTRPAGFIEAQADWENRQVMVMAMTRLLDDGRDGVATMSMARAGFTPWVRDYGKVHLWLFGQVMHHGGSDDRWQPALVGRIFYRSMLLEAGVTDQGGLIINSQFRF